MTLYVNDENVTYFDSFRTEHIITEGIRNFLLMIISGVIKWFSINVKITKLCRNISGKYRKCGKPKISYFLEKTLVLEKLFKEEEPIEILKIFGFIENI